MWAWATRPREAGGRANSYSAICGFFGSTPKNLGSYAAGTAGGGCPHMELWG
jgi:hypothetical protein